MKTSMTIVLGLVMSACCSASPAPTPEPEVDTGSNLTCDERLEGANKHWGAVHEANLTCAADTDCALVFTGTDCRGACQVAVNATGAPLLESAVAEASVTFCKDFQADGCPYATPKCALGAAYCNAGTCDVRYGQ